MPVTNFSGGLSSFGFPLLGAGPYLGVGNVFFVSSVIGTDANGRGTDPVRPFKTINFALTKCSAPSSNPSKPGGDFIFVMPGHVETIAGAGSAASPTGSISVNVAGVTIVGLGVGTQRPLIQWTATAGKIFVGAANTTFTNLVFDMASQIASVVVGITIGVAETAFTGCTFYTSTSAQASLIAISLTVGWAGCIITSCQFRSNGGLPFAAGTSTIAAVAGDRLYIGNCFFNVDNSTSVVDGGAIILTNVLIEWNEFIQNNAARLLIKGSNSSTGLIHDNSVQVNGGAVAGVVSGTGWVWNQNFGKGAASGTASGILVPGTASF